MSDNFTRAWPSKSDRLRQQNAVAERIGDVLELLKHEPVAPQADVEAIRASLREFDFDHPIGTVLAAEKVVELMKGGMVHMMHPGYFGLFNPTIVFPGIIADIITASLNPQLAVWSHAAVPVEIERRVIQEVGAPFDQEFKAGHFTSGGAEANNTAVLLALTRANTRFAEEGAKTFKGLPCLYVSAESHLAWHKIAHQSGIGRAAVRLVDTDGTGRMDVTYLTRAVEEDRSAGNTPVFIAATAGTTNAGMIDPLIECANIAEQFGMWFHVDAAWGGAIRFLPEHSAVLNGIQRANSITLDAHKWLAVPMGAGILLCKDNDLLGETFRVTASYMPEGLASLNPYTHSMQWSRRFIGLKLFLSLATIGWEGYRYLLRNALTLSARLTALLDENGWSVVNDSPLAVLCFEDTDRALDLEKVVASVVADGRTWISSVKFEGRRVLRACITSHHTEEENLTDLISALEAARVEQMM
ncbi:MAG: pyridoxal-dependent decarboxylase [Gammaproteobacteria bacterium]